jgi:hypothetical protein
MRLPGSKTLSNPKENTTVLNLDATKVLQQGKHHIHKEVRKKKSRVMNKN